MLGYRATRTLLGAALILSLAGCARPTAIGDLARHPEKYRQLDVVVRGHVVSSFALPIAGQKGFYVVSDGTGQIGVISSSSAPAVNSDVTVTGRLDDVPAVALPAVKQFKIAEVMIRESKRESRESVSSS